MYHPLAGDGAHARRPRSGRPSRSGRPVRSRRRFEAGFLALAAPAAVVYLGFLVGPVLAGFYFSLTRWDGLNEPIFVGLENFVRLVSDHQFIGAVGHTLLFAVVIVAGQVGLGLGLALLLNRPRRGVAIYRGLFFAPSILSSVVVALIWGFIFNPLVGVLGQAARALGLGEGGLADVLGNQATALLGVSAVVIWQFAGYMMVIFLAGLKGIPADVYEAASLDGAAGARRFWYVTLPLLAPATSVAITISLAGNLRLFDQVYLLTGGGPAGATDTIATLIYRTAFANSDFGYSATQSVVLTILVTIVVLGQRWLASRRNRT